jgi:hypothetical protein
LAGLSFPVIELAIFAVLVLGPIIFFLTRRLQRGPNRVMARAAAAPSSSAGAAGSGRRTTPYEDRYRHQDVPADGRPLMLNLFVEDQNTFIGKRNIHLVKQGYTFTLGGGKSDFLIFLVPLPARIAEIRYEENQCTFVPRKSQYFPDIGAQPVPDCIGKTIRIISDKKYELRMRLEWYEDPLISLNKLMHSVSIPG